MAAKAMELRSLPASYQSDGRTLSGYAAVWDTPTVINESGRTYSEVVRRGAFTRSLKESPDVLCCFNHDLSRLLGRTSSGTMTLSEDGHGLRFSVELPETETGREVRELAQRGDLRGASFAFTVRAEKWATRQDRELIDVNLYECGPVITPAYPITTIGLRSNAKWYKAKLKLLELA